MAVKGVDLSEMNGPVDFAALKAAGVRFVILRAGYGRDYPGQQDKEFEANVQKAEAIGMPWGAYHYAYAQNAAGGKAEAAHFLRLLRGRKPSCGAWYDMEDASILGGDLPGAAEAFCTAVQEAGLRAGVYANLNWWENCLVSPVFDKYERWCAQYNHTCQLKKPYGLWQYTDAWEIGGKKFDGNLAYRDYSASAETGEDKEKLSYEQWKEYQARYERELAAKPVSGWAKQDVARVRAAGIMLGDSSGSFRSRSHVSREELAAVANRILTEAKK